MASIKKTPQVKSSAFPRWDSSLPFDIATYNIPRVFLSFFLSFLFLSSQLKSKKKKKIVK